MSDLLTYDNHLRADAVPALMGFLQEFTHGADRTNTLDLEKIGLPKKYRTEEDKRRVVTDSSDATAVADIMKLHEACKRGLTSMARAEIGIARLSELKPLIMKLQGYLSRYLLYEPDPEKVHAIVGKYDAEIEKILAIRDQAKKDAEQASEESVGQLDTIVEDIVLSLEDEAMLEDFDLESIEVCDETEG